MTIFKKYTVLFVCITEYNGLNIFIISTRLLKCTYKKQILLNPTISTINVHLSYFKLDLRYNEQMDKYILFDYFFKVLNFH